MCRYSSRLSSSGWVWRHPGRSRCKLWWKSQKTPGQSQRSQPQAEQQEDELKKPQVKFMDHVISKDGLKPDPDKAKAVKAHLQERHSESTGFHKLSGQISTQTIWSSAALERFDPGQRPICMVQATWQGIWRSKKVSGKPSSSQVLWHPRRGYYLVRCKWTGSGCNTPTKCATS